MRRPIALACVLASLSAAFVPVAGLAPAPRAADDDVIFWPRGPEATVRTFEIDGRTITLEATLIRNPFNLVPNRFATYTTTNVYVSMRVHDGALLPEGLEVVGVRFEKLRGIRRFFFVPVDQYAEGDGGDDFEEHSLHYEGDLSDHPSVRFLKVVVRLERGDEVIKVNMGTMPVQLWQAE